MAIAIACSQALGTITTDYQRKRLKECRRCLYPAQRQFQRFTSGTSGG